MEWESKSIIEELFILILLDTKLLDIGDFRLNRLFDNDWFSFIWWQILLKTFACVYTLGSLGTNYPLTPSIWGKLCLIESGCFLNLGDWSKSTDIYLKCSLFLFTIRLDEINFESSISSEFSDFNDEYGLFYLRFAAYLGVLNSGK